MLRTDIHSCFKARREQLAKNNPGAVFLFPSAGELIRNDDVHFPFRQESSFYYLTGFEEPESFLVLLSNKDGKSRSILFARERNRTHELWEGERYGVERIVSVFGVDEAYSIREIEARLVDLLELADEVYYRVGTDHRMDTLVLGLLDRARGKAGRTGRGLLPLRDWRESVGELRLFKKPEEVAWMRKACEATAAAHLEVMEAVRPGMLEWEVEARLDYGFRARGCRRLGYGSIVAGGKNATCLHYRDNNEALRDGDLLLLDAGGEYEYYSADITRTFPVGKVFSREQAAIYDLVLEAQKTCIGMAKPGVRFREIHDRAVEVLTEGLIRLGLLVGKSEDLIKTLEYKRFYPHNTGHWLGMDVHDIGLYQKPGEKQSRVLEPGMVFTIEPGIYCQPDDSQCPPQYRGIGIRIEDDVLITATGNEVLTRAAIKEREEIESVRRRAIEKK